MEDRRNLLSPSEWRVMECLWSGPKTLMELVRALKDSAGWAKSTVTTMVRRLEEKGLVDHETSGRTKIFQAALAREDAAAAEAEAEEKSVTPGMNKDFKGTGAFKMKRRFQKPCGRVLLEASRTPPPQKPRKAR